MKEFTIAAKVAADEDEIEAPLTFMIDKDEVRAYRPTSGQVAVMFTTLSRYATDTERMSGTIDFFLNMLDDNSRRVIGQRLMARDDPLELEDITSIMSWLMEQWAARPTRPSSASSPSRRSTGRRSTATSRNGASTPSLTGSTDSAT